MPAAKCNVIQINKLPLVSGDTGKLSSSAEDAKAPEKVPRHVHGAPFIVVALDKAKANKGSTRVAQAPARLGDRRHESRKGPAIRGFIIRSCGNCAGQHPVDEPRRKCPIIVPESQLWRDAVQGRADAVDKVAGLEEGVLARGPVTMVPCDIIYINSISTAWYMVGPTLHCRYRDDKF